MAMPPAPWREGLGPASFRGAFFHVEIGGQASGRRVAMHEYPKRNTPYAEDMGKSATAFRITGYLIGPDYIGPRDALIAACEADGPGRLLLPKLSAMTVMCMTYSVSEFRERGGYCAFEFQFIEAGVPGFSNIGTSTNDEASKAAKDAAIVVGETLNRSLKQ